MRISGHILALLALITLIGMPLTPAVAKLIAQDGQRYEICTTQGIKTIVFDDEGNAREINSDKDHATGGTAHCPYCLGRFGLTLAPDAPTILAPNFVTRDVSLDISTSRSITKNTHIYYRPRDPPLSRT